MRPWPTVTNLPLYLKLKFLSRNVRTKHLTIPLRVLSSILLGNNSRPDLQSFALSGRFYVPFGFTTIAPRAFLALTSLLTSSPTRFPPISTSAPRLISLSARPCPPCRDSLPGINPKITPPPQAVAWSHRVHDILARRCSRMSVALISILIFLFSATRGSITARTWLPVWFYSTFCLPRRIARWGGCLFCK